MRTLPAPANPPSYAPRASHSLAQLIPGAPCLSAACGRSPHTMHSTHPTHWAHTPQVNAAADLKSLALLIPAISSCCSHPSHSSHSTLLTPSHAARNPQVNAAADLKSLAQLIPATARLVLDPGAMPGSTAPAAGSSTSVDYMQVDTRTVRPGDVIRVLPGAWATTESVNVWRCRDGGWGITVWYMASSPQPCNTKPRFAVRREHSHRWQGAGGALFGG